MGGRTGRIVTSSSIELLGSQVVVVKRRRAGGGTRPGPDRAPGPGERTEAEAGWLVAARHPSVVRVRRVAPAEGVLITDHAGLLTLRTWRPSLPEAAWLLSRLAATIDDLHRRGLVHGNLGPDHVIVGGPGELRPLLCSPAPPAPGQPTDPGVDVSALADLAASVAARYRWAPRWGRVVDDLRSDGPAIGAAGAADRFARLGALAASAPVRLVDSVAAVLPAERGPVRGLV